MQIETRSMLTTLVTTSGNWGCTHFSVEKYTMEIGKDFTNKTITDSTLLVFLW